MHSVCIRVRVTCMMKVIGVVRCVCRLSEDLREDVNVRDTPSNDFSQQRTFD